MTRNIVDALYALRNSMPAPDADAHVLAAWTDAVAAAPIGRDYASQFAPKRERIIAALRAIDAGSAAVDDDGLTAWDGLSLSLDDAFDWLGDVIDEVCDQDEWDARMGGGGHDADLTDSCAVEYLTERG